ncbi:MAG: antibiotic biosynthesis monooxygenase [Firmicutes bacterium]|nr:antibiotic biosynthesis monooxygenase [Bacillota bacterium]
MFSVFIDFTVQEGKESLFEKREKKLLEILKKKKGFISYFLFKDSEGNGRYRGIQLWEDEESSRASREDEEFKELIRSTPVLKSAPGHRYGMAVELE